MPHILPLSCGAFALAELHFRKLKMHEKAKVILSNNFFSSRYINVQRITRSQHFTSKQWSYLKNFTGCKRRDTSNGFRFKVLPPYCVAGASAESWGAGYSAFAFLGFPRQILRVLAMSLRATRRELYNFETNKYFCTETWHNNLKTNNRIVL